MKELAACKQLQSLNLGLCAGVTDAGLEALAACKQLRSLDVRLCGRVSAAGIAALNKALPELKIKR